MYMNNYARSPQFVPSSSPTPTPTYTPTYDEPGGVWPTSTSGGSVWDGSGGPALIVVFVALGLLVGAFTALIILRRYPPSTAFLADLDAWYMTSQPAVNLDDEPELYEVQLVVLEKGGDMAVRKNEHLWRDMKPLSASFVPDEPVLEEIHLATLENHTVVEDPSRPNALVRGWDAIRHYYFPPNPAQTSLPMHMSRSPSSLRTPHIDEKETGNGLQGPVSGQLQVAVAIAMPSRESSVYYAPQAKRLSQNSDCVTEPVPEFSFGLAQFRANMPPP